MQGIGEPPSEYAPSRRPAPARPRSESPAADAFGPGFVVTTSAAPIVHLSGARARLLALAAAEQRHTILLTEDSARLTPAMIESLELFGGKWVVHGEQGLRDVALGIRLPSIDAAVRPPSADAVTAPEHAAIPFREHDLHAVLVVNGTIRHRNARQGRYGDAVRVVADALLGGAALDWGVREPVVTPWESDELAAFVRARVDRAPSIVVSGGGEDGRLAVGSVRVRNTATGAEEAFGVRVDLGPVNEAATAERWLAVAEALVEVADIGTPLYIAANAEVGLPDLSLWPWFRPPALPMAVFIGAPGIARFSLAERRELIETHFAAEFVGSQRRPSLVVELGEQPHPDNVDELAALFGVLGADAIEAGLGATMPRSLYGADWRDVVHRAAVEKVGEAAMATPDAPGDDREDAGDEEGAHAV